MQERKNSVNHKNNQLVSFHGGMRIGFSEFDRFVLNNLVLPASLALMTSLHEKMLKTRRYNYDCLLMIEIYHISKKLP